MTELPNPKPIAAAPPAPGAPGALAPTCVEAFDEAGRCVARTAMLGGVPHGETLRYGKDGVRVLQAHYVGGKLCGPLRVFDESGALAQESVYEADLLHGPLSAYQDGRLAARRHYVLGVQHGESVTYAPSGLMTSRQFYEAGKLARESVFMHEGVVVRRANYRDGLLEGETRDYAADGTLTQSAPYQRGLLHGTLRRFAPNGEVSAERRYANGKPLGPWQSPLAAAPQTDDKGAPRMMRNLEKWMRGE